jgi:hypothetical protein
MNKLKEFRHHQAEADDAIYEELLINNKCIVKMFCGTGKSLLMRKCKSWIWVAERRRLPSISQTTHVSHLSITTMSRAKKMF